MDLRIMTSNVWADVFNNPVEGRDKELSTVYLRYMPDILCLQEVHPSWHNSNLKPPLFEAGYDEITGVDLADNTNNYTPLLFRADKLEVLDKGFVKFAGLNDFGSKSATWARFWSKADGTEFVAAATHLYWTADEAGEKARISNCREILDCAEPFISKGIPLLCGGDFNCVIGSAPQRFLEEKGMISSSRVCEKMTEDISSHHGDPIYDPNLKKFKGKRTTNPNEMSLDHIMVSGNVKVKTYTVVCDAEALDATDHSPVYIDVEI